MQQKEDEPRRFLEIENVEKDLTSYPLKPILIEAQTAHQGGLISYDASGTVTFRHPELCERGLPNEIIIPTSHQFPIVRATIDDLGPKLSSLANSPLVNDQTLRERYEEEASRYEAIATEAHARGEWEPNYGSYVYDVVDGKLFLIAPPEWHRLSLVTSNSKLLTDPEGKLTWAETRKKLEQAVVGVAGASVGGGIFDGWLRDGRPLRAKIADLDILEGSNLNRITRMDIRNLVGSRAQRLDPRSPYDNPRVSKVESLARLEHLIDPYAIFDVYAEGLSRENMERFLLGDGEDEPRLDVLVEEVDDLRLKIELRNLCRQFGIPVLMMSDLGHRAQVLWQDFSKDQSLSLAPGVSDEEVYERLEAAYKDRKGKFKFIETICGSDYAVDEFKDWVEGRGEQMGSSLPQLGTTAKASAGIGGFRIAEYILGRQFPVEERLTYDLRYGTVFRS